MLSKNVEAFIGCDAEYESADIVLMRSDLMDVATAIKLSRATIRNIKQKIVTGEIQKGERLPSRREMAVTINVNPNTVQKAYKEMEEMGIINTIKNNQSTITDDDNLM